MPRDRLITIIDLHMVMRREKDENERGMFIICEFNEMDIGFHVTKVHGIQRISWTDIEKPPQLSQTYEQSIATGVAKIGDKIIRNRLACQAMEGCDGTTDGSPDTLTKRRYERFNDFDSCISEL